MILDKAYMLVNLNSLLLKLVCLLLRIQNYKGEQNNNNRNNSNRDFSLMGVSAKLKSNLATQPYLMEVYQISHW